MKKAAVIGCSLSSGWKLKNNNHVGHEDPDHPCLWSNQLLHAWGYNDISNFASTGASNQTIFQLAVQRILSTRYDLVLVQWTFLDRINFNVGLELYPTRSMLKSYLDINLVNGVTVSGPWLQDLGDRIKSISNLHWTIVQLTQYVNLLALIQTHHRAKVCFVNGACMWPDRYFEKINYDSPGDLPKFTQNLLQVDLRDDSEILDLYHMTHDDYEQNQGIQNNLWLNLYNPLVAMKIDTMSKDDFHPGLASQDLFFEKLHNQEHSYAVAD